MCTQVTKHRRHHHFWIDDGRLYESYTTIRGLRFRELIDVNLPDQNKALDSYLKHNGITIIEQSN